MFVLHLPLAVFNFLLKLSSFALASKSELFFVLLFIYIYWFFQDILNANLTFAVYRTRDSKSPKYHWMCHRMLIRSRERQANSHFHWFPYMCTKKCLNSHKPPSCFVIAFQAIWTKKLVYWLPTYFILLSACARLTILVANDKAAKWSYDTSFKTITIQLCL